MKKEDLIKRRSLLEMQKEQLIAQVNLVMGSIQEINFQIGEMDKEEAAQVPLENPDETKVNQSPIQH